MSGPDYYQKPAPFELADEVTLLNGKTVSGAKARLYDLLRHTRDTHYRHEIGTELGPPGWVPRHLLVEPWSGGAAGDRRLRDLQADHGVAYIAEPFTNAAGERTDTWVYRLAESLPRGLEPALGPEGSPTPAGPPPAEGPAPPHGAAAPPAAAVATNHAQVAEEVTGPRRRGSAARRTGSVTLRFYTSIGNPAGVASILVHNQEWAPPRVLIGRLVRGEVSPAKASELYLAHLRACYQRGALDPLLEIDQVVVLYVWPVAPFNPLPELTRALVACEADYRGEWVQQHERGIA